MKEKPNLKSNTFTDFYVHKNLINAKRNFLVFNFPGIYADLKFVFLTKCYVFEES